MIITLKKKFQEFPDSLVVRTALVLQEAWVQSLVGKLRSCKPCGMTKKKKIIFLG